jgi:hypothetical protein
VESSIVVFRAILFVAFTLPDVFLEFGFEHGATLNLFEGNLAAALISCLDSLDASEVAAVS